MKYLCITIKTKAFIVFFLVFTSLSITAQNPLSLFAERKDTSSPSINMINPEGVWHISGPRSYESNNNLSIFWKKADSSFKRYLTIAENGYMGIGTSTPVTNLDVHTTNHNSALGISISQGSVSGNRNSGRLFFENEGEKSKSFAIMKVDDRLSFRGNAVAGGNSGLEYFSINNKGNMGIGTANPKGFKLGVNGRIAATEIKVANYDNWPDYVFKTSYNLPTLAEVENHINRKGHLKNLPSALEVKNKGFFLGEMDAKLLQKIEELTLYTIEQQKLIELQSIKIKELEQDAVSIKYLKQRLLKIEKKVNVN